MPPFQQNGSRHDGMRGGGGATLKDLRNIGTVKRLFAFIMKNYKVHIGIVLVCIVISSVTSLASSLFTRSLIDDYITPMLSSSALGSALGPDYHPLAIALVKLGAIILAGVIAGYAYNMIMIFVGQGTMRKLRESLFYKMEKLPLSYFDSHAHGDIMSVYTNDIDTLRQVIGNSVPRLFQSLITIVATFISMIVLSIPLTVIAVIMAFVMFKVTTSLGKISRKYFTERQKNLGIMNGFIEEMVSGQKVVKVYSHEKKAMEQFSTLSENLRSSVFNANKVGNIIMPINANLGEFAYVFLAIGGALVALGGYTGWYLCGLDGTAMTLGTIVSFLSLQRNFIRPVSQISNEVNSIVMASAGTDRVYAMMDQSPEKDEGKVTLVNAVKGEDGTLSESGSRTGKWAWKKDGHLTELEGLVSLKDVDFSYVEGKQVLFDISLTAYPGQQIAFVGGTGAGKTTITNLINRFYEIQDGTITYDGFNVGEIEKDSLRRSLGTVLQETNLFSGTVMENIRYGRLDATDEECRAAARLVYADPFIRRLPNGYDTVLSADGGNLSQGERQLLSIARAAVADPPVLILDEATSSIDTRTEKMIQMSMASLMKGRTTFVIAHRLSTVQNADYIMVLDKGRIIERGKHWELLEQKGKYYELYTGNQITA
ncbi:MAG: ABC transporter ATP-binding protein [Bacteroidales bacterium]|nr:ABC transporter ATP-binding protein [Bacteroidales bacterium]